MDYKASCKLIEFAYECGFRHFDVAPSYGHGMAERILGDTLAPVRDTVTIVTKTGIPHPKSVSGFRLLRRLLLPVKSMFPSVWKASSGQARRMVAPPGKFSKADILVSVEESLRRLQTDWVDTLLLHEVQPQDVNEELMDTLDDLRTLGRVRAIGLGTYIESTVTLLDRHPDVFDVVQVNHYWGAFAPELSSGTHRLITHRCLRSGRSVIESAPFQERLAHDETARELKDALSDPMSVPALLLTAGLSQNASGRLLISTSKRERVAQFAEIGRALGAGSLVHQLNDHLAKSAATISLPDN